ncbi:hypothetical protein P8C59_008507 [Phyllachora maydis]|uniref:Uncharacterized protein n=1 Tax=Phyllachora maydis TaxID=1825666 RepID=A0AAD9IBJ1_9PEZI|nr:hypothetical protein P8C59_008507 [Phyllachora maydis]
MAASLDPPQGPADADGAKAIDFAGSVDSNNELPSPETLKSSLESIALGLRHVPASHVRVKQEEHPSFLEKVQNVLHSLHRPFPFHEDKVERDGRPLPAGPLADVDLVADTDNAVLMQKLTAEYARLADSFLGSAIAPALAEAHQGFVSSIAAGAATEQAALARLEQRVSGTFARLSDEMIEYTQREAGQDAPPTTECLAAGEIVARARAVVETEEAELDRLWGEWEAAQAEVGEAARSLMLALGGTARQTEHVDWKVGTSFEEEAVEMVAEAMEEAKECEKSYRQSIAKDIQIYMDSISF